jgi:hypothetical protein
LHLEQGTGKDGKEMMERNKKKGKKYPTKV